MIDPIYVTATVGKCAAIRGLKDADTIAAILKAQPSLLMIVQVAFEAGREWQSNHPTAETDWPDYEASEKI